MSAEAESKWQWLLENPPEGLSGLIAKASLVEELRCLYPFTVQDWLCFSSMQGYPQDVTGPRVRATQEQTLEVWLRWRGKDQFRGAGDESLAMELVLAALADCV